MIDITNRFQLRGSILSINQSNDDLIITKYYVVFKLDTSLKSKELPHKYLKISGDGEDVRVHIYDRFQCEEFYTLYREVRDLAFGGKGFGKDDEIVDFCAKNAMDSILKNSDDERIKIEFRHQKTLQ